MKETLDVYEKLIKEWDKSIEKQQEELAVLHKKALNIKEKLQRDSTNAANVWNVADNSELPALQKNISGLEEKINSAQEKRQFLIGQRNSLIKTDEASQKKSEGVTEVPQRPTNSTWDFNWIIAFYKWFVSLFKEVHQEQQINPGSDSSGDRRNPEGFKGPSN